MRPNHANGANSAKDTARERRLMQIREQERIDSLKPPLSIDRKKYAVTKYRTAQGSQLQRIAPRRPSLAGRTVAERQPVTKLEAA